MLRLHELIDQRRSELIGRWQVRVRGALSPTGTAPLEILDSLPFFIDELVHGLAHAGGEPQAVAGRSAVASAHGQQRFHAGFNVEATIREYRTLEDCILELAQEHRVQVGIGEMRALSALIGTGVAEAVSMFMREKEERELRHAIEQFSYLVHELRNPMSSAMLALDAVPRAAQSSEGFAALRRSLNELRLLIDESLVELRLRALRGVIEPDRQPVGLRAVAEEVREALAGEALNREVEVRVEVEPDHVVLADPRLLRSVLLNLVNNGIKFTRPGTAVVVRSSGDEGRRTLEVEDRCGGLEPGIQQRMFDPFVQLGRERSGFGLGLALVRQAVQAMGGSIQVRDLGHGCAFLVDLPAAAGQSG